MPRIPDFQALLKLALAEDEAGRDVTTQTFVPHDCRIEAVLSSKQSGVVCGLEAAQAAFRWRTKLKVRLWAQDGQKIKPGQKILTVSGRAREVLARERAAINFLQHLSGIATLTRQFIDAANNPKVKILDTRKTLPGWRILEKYAVRSGGGTNHRLNLSSMAMLKDNHLKILERFPRQKKLSEILPRATQLAIEAENLAQVDWALRMGADLIMLDNMPMTRLKQAIALIRARSRSVLIEVTGGVTLKNVRAMAQLSPDRISIGALTHSAPAVNFSLEVTSVFPA